MSKQAFVEKYSSKLTGIETSANNHDGARLSRIREANAARLEAQLAGQGLPRVQAAMNEPQLARADNNALAKPNFPDELVTIPGYDLYELQNLMQQVRLAKLLYGLDVLMNEADKLGLGEQITVMVSSNFARDPGYNGNDQYAGKDHWPITSAMLMGVGIQGDRVLGSTDDDHYAQLHQGTILTPAHIHHSLRALAGIRDHKLAQDFPLAGEDLDLFA